MEQFLIFGIVFLAVFVQSLAGFGVALIAMALLPAIIGIRTATPLVAFVSLAIEIFLIIRYRSDVNFTAVKPIIFASLPGILLGVWALRSVDERVILTILGIVISGYAFYGLLNLKLPLLEHPFWAYGAGFIGGVLGGAYNTSGPPVIIYGNCRRWSPLEFKGNLQGFFIISSLVIFSTHYLSRNFTAEVIYSFLWAIPAILLGFLAGTYLDRFLNPNLFSKVVLLLLLFMGARLIV